MENNRQNLTLDGLSVAHTFFIMTALGIIATTIYLTAHYFNMHFPSGGLNETSALCNINSYFTCDSATMDHLSNLGGVPISFFGLMIGVSFLMGSIFPSESFEKTNKTLATVNAIGCFILFLYSITVLKTLCPFCSLYYILSWAAFYLLWKKGIKEWFSPDIKILAILGMILFGGSFLFYNHHKDLKARQASINNSLVDQFYKLNNMGVAKFESPYILASSGAKFGEAPLNILIFSDFQCPYCKVAQIQWEEIANHFKGKININYYFYPLDSNCHPKMTSAMHPVACKAAYVALCSPNFKQTHDELFTNQEKLNNEWLDAKIKELGIDACVKDASSKEKVVQTITAGEQFNVASTPTFIVNGVKIEGGLPTAQFITLLEEIVRRQTK